MQTFLDKITEYVNEKYPENISDICFVLPNRRASLFLRKSLAKRIKANSWSPAICSIEDFIHNLSGLTILDNTSLLFELYIVHQEIAKDKAQDFDEFTKWGQTLLHDFNEIDQHLAPAKALFNYLSDLKSLSNWNPESTDPTEFQKQYINFFQSLYFYYEQLNQNLLSRQSAYSGMAYKFVSERIDDLSKNLNYHKIVFAGFNALSISEENILYSLKNEARADILWDADPYYINKLDSDVQHEAGYFLRKYIEKQKNTEFNWIENTFDKEEKEINIYGVPKQIGQAKLCGQLLNQNPELKSGNYNSAIVLADENLLFPILNSLPELKELNATMGIPLESTPLYDFIKLILELINRSFQIHEVQKKSTNIFYKNDVIKLLNHSILHELCKEVFNRSTSEYLEVINKLTASNKSQFSEIEIIESLKKIESPFINSVLTTWKNDTDSILQKLKGILELIRDALISKQKDIDLNLKVEIEYTYLLSILLTKISNYQKKYGSIKKIKSLYSFFKQLSKTEKLALYGEPLQGLQLMGVLETRILDFENLIICSVNENIIPSSSKQNSFIPFDIKREYGLPTYREKNAVFAYHFFRLLQRARNTHLIYNTEADPIAGGDKSRFIYQLQNELKSFKNIKIKEHIVTSNLLDKNDVSIKYKKDDAAIKRLIEKAQSGFSPSSLNVYKRCSLQFYFKEITKLGDIRRENETIDAATLGSIIHEVLQVIYEPLEKSEVTIEYLEKSLSKLDGLLESGFKNLYRDGNTKQGKNLLIAKVAKSFIQKYLRLEINNIRSGNNIKIKTLEENYTHSIDTTNGNFPAELKQILFKGFIDRIDTFNEEVRIIDYKTGIVKKTELNIKDWDSIFTDPKTDKSFQLVFYAWLYSKSSIINSDISSGIYSLKNPSQGFLEISNPDKEKLNKKDLLEFENGLTKLLENIFDPSQSFEQTTDLSICSYCNYKIICNK